MSEVTSTVYVDSTVSGILTAASAAPASFRIDEGGTVLRYRLAREGAVRVVVQDEAGRPVWDTDTSTAGGPGRSAGWHEAPWNGVSFSGMPVPPGHYTAVVLAGDGVGKETRVVRLNVLDAAAGLRGGGPGNAGVSSSARASGGSAAGPAGAGPASGGSGAAAASSPASSDQTHDNGMENGRNPHDLGRGSNPGQHGGDR